MSLSTVEEIRCACGEVFEAEIYQSVSTTQNPELKEAILAGEFNLVPCPACRQVLYIEHFLLYHDASQELLAFVYPKDFEQRNEEIQVGIAKDFTQLQATLAPKEQFKYKPFFIYGLDQLCTLVRLEEEIGMEAEVVEALCPHLGLSCRWLHRDSARRKNLLPLLPLDPTTKVQDKDFKLSLLMGLGKILECNDHLVHYKDLLRRIETTLELPLDPSDFV
jgi:hypothetical protein